MVPGALRLGGEGPPFPRERNGMVGEHLLHPRHVRTHQRIRRHHERLMTVADAVGPARRLHGRRRPHDQHRFFQFAHHHHEPRLLATAALIESAVFPRAAWFDT